MAIVAILVINYVDANPLAHNCDDAFTKAAISSPFTQFSWYTTQIVIVCTTITNLIK